MHAWQSSLFGLPIARAIDSTGKYRNESAPKCAAISAYISSEGRPRSKNGGANSSRIRDMSMP
jgi:hypothetical protein